MPKKKQAKKYNSIFKNKGIILIEAVVGIALFTIVSLSVYKVVISSYQNIRQSLKKTEALNLANQKMENIRNMSYGNIGTVEGNPSGSIPSSETVIGKYGTYIFTSTISYIDDTFDGVSPTDTDANDYKKASITVQWQATNGTQNIYLSSIFTPTQTSALLGNQNQNGIIKINVINASGQPVNAANLAITNSLVSPAVNINATTASDGIYTISNAAPSINGYHIVASKTNYSSDQTYTITQQNPNPIKPDLSVFANQLSQVTLVIDQLSTLNITTLTQFQATENKINTASGSDNQNKPSMAIDSSGNIFFVWYDGGNQERIYSQKYQVDQNNSWTSIWGNDKQLTTSNNMDNPNISMANTAGNDFYVGWHKNVSGNDQVYLQKFNSSGNAVWSQDFKITSEANSANQLYPNVAVDPAEKVYIAWQDYRNTNADAYIKRVTTQSGKGKRSWTSDVKLSSTSSGAQEYPKLAIDSSNYIYAVWQDSRNGNYDIYAQKLNSSKTKQWANDVLCHFSNANNQTNPDIKIGSGNSIYIAWQEMASGNSDIYLQKLNTSGTKQWTSDKKISYDSSANQTKPKLAIDSSGNIYVVWQDDRNGNNDIYAMKLDSSGAKLWASDLAIVYGNSNQENPVISINTSNGFIYVSWDSDISGNDDIYSTQINPAQMQNAFQAVGNVPFTFRGNKKISENPLIYKYPSQNYTTNSSGTKNLLNMEWDTYEINIAGNYKLDNAVPSLPVNLNPNSTVNENLYVSLRSGFDFVIEDGGVTPTSNFGVSNTVLGAALNYGGSYDMPITAKIKIGAQEFEPWGSYSLPVSSNLNNGTGPIETELSGSFASGSEVSLISKAWVKKSGRSGNNNSDWDLYREVNSTVDLDRIYVLRDGDDVPDVEGYMNQENIADFIEHYISNNKVVLADNQAIFLFEYCDDLNSSCADFQDLVVLLNLNSVN